LVHPRPSPSNLPVLLGLLPLILGHRPALKHAAKYALFQCGKAGAAACSWSGYVYDFVQCDAPSLYQNDAVCQTYGLGNVMSYEHCGKTAVSPNVLDELLHFDACERVQRS
jgi:hypothetical protein